MAVFYAENRSVTTGWPPTSKGRRRSPTSSAPARGSGRSIDARYHPRLPGCPRQRYWPVLARRNAENVDTARKSECRGRDSKYSQRTGAKRKPGHPITKKRPYGAKGGQVAPTEMDAKWTRARRPKPSAGSRTSRPCGTGNLIRTPRAARLSVGAQLRRFLGHLGGPW